MLPESSALEEWRSGVSNYNITLDTLLASCYEARSIYAGQHLCNAVRQEDCLPRGSPSLAADRHQHRRQERAKEQGQMEKKRRYLMQPNFQSLYTLQRVAALYVMCAIVQCCWSEGLPNARQTNFGVGSMKKKKKRISWESSLCFSNWLCKLVPQEL